MCCLQYGFNGDDQRDCAADRCGGARDVQASSTADLPADHLCESNHRNLRLDSSIHHLPTGTYISLYLVVMSAVHIGQSFISIGTISCINMNL